MDCAGHRAWMVTLAGFSQKVSHILGTTEQLSVTCVNEVAQGAPRDPLRESRGERSPWLPLETRPDSPGEPGMQPRDPCLPWRGKLGPGHTLR